jgi:putative serine protease PepD
MERGGLTGGDIPEDPDGTGDETGSPQRGWLSPEDRLWRHPSEVSASGLSRPLFPHLGSGPAGTNRRRAHRSSLAAGAVGIAAVATTLAVVLALVDSHGTTAAPKFDAQGGVNAVAASTTSLTSMPIVGHDVMRLVASVRPSLVGLEPVGADGPVNMTGVVLPGGALVVTAASAVAGASQLDVITATGKRLRGQVMGSDADSGVAVIETEGGLTPATFADEDVQPSDLDIVACLCAEQASSPPSSNEPAAAAVGMVEEVGTGVTVEGGIELVNAIEAEMPLGPTSWGGVLLDSHGRVLGILDGQMNAGDDTIGLFVPAPLAEGVALELAKNHQVDHGWLGVNCTDEDGGAEVTSVFPGSPALKAGLEAGDVVVGVDSHSVDSVADLKERLYTVSPGTTVQLEVEHGASHSVVSVQLADTPDG